MTQVEIASQRMFGQNSLQVKNVGFTLGSNPNVTAEDIARELNKALDQLEEGNFEEVML